MFQLQLVAKKVKYAIDNGLSVIACIGETVAEREAGNTLNVCYSQMAPIAGKLE